jgi:hypothetical protein
MLCYVSCCATLYVQYQACNHELIETKTALNIAKNKIATVSTTLRATQSSTLIVAVATTASSVIDPFVIRL